MLRRVILILIAATFACGLPLHATFASMAHMAHATGSAPDGKAGSPCPQHPDKKGFLASECGVACDATVTIARPPTLIEARTDHRIDFLLVLQDRARSAVLLIDPFPPKLRTFR